MADAGRFAVSAGAAATELTIRVSSATQGQEFFTAVEVRDAPLRLEYRLAAALEGVARWTDGSPAAGLLVFASGEVPEAPPLERYSLTATTDEEGKFLVEGRLRAAPVRLEIRQRGAPKEPSWTSDVLVPTPGETLVLGPIDLAE